MNAVVVQRLIFSVSDKKEKTDASKCTNLSDFSGDGHEVQVPRGEDVHGGDIFRLRELEEDHR